MSVTARPYQSRPSILVFIPIWVRTCLYEMAKTIQNKTDTIMSTDW